ncbi:hypothetical protein [Streptomyces chiangmaiensis]|uniref:Uncharacterized protein n=1 Tax=Streptomyces chiangmaiensis TaxID=766497 RepID=A0ABU7FW10_9ACTN|nr:hypothetical protein [Streptomyces chiangmaiensis]MED7828070.1 hypothetical protein [Streptomyces chiangmaiensis]
MAAAISAILDQSERITQDLLKKTRIDHNSESVSRPGTSVRKAG